MRQDDPIQRFSVWLRTAAKRTPGPFFDATAMTLATSGKDGQPAARMVLLKRFGPDGFTFFTNYGSRKGRQLSENPQAAPSSFSIGASALAPWSSESPAFARIIPG